MEIWEVVAREQIRDTLARYNWSGDAGRVDDLAATFCPDGMLEIRGARSLRGRGEIARFLTGVTADVATTAAHSRPVVRHLITNGCSVNSLRTRRSCDRISPWSLTSGSTTWVATATSWFPRRARG